MSEKQKSSRSWFCVLNNPEKILGEHTPDELVNIALDKWCENYPQRCAAVNYEIGDNGTPHMHMVLEDPAKTRFTAVQKYFPGIHIEPTRGTKEDAENYILKRGKFAEKEHTVIVPAVIRGEIKAQKGKRNDLSIIEELIEQGKKPNEIMDMGIYYRQFEKSIKAHYFAKRYKETPAKRDVKVFWHVGESGSGKSHAQLELYEKYGENEVYLMTDYENGGFDSYMGEKVLFMDEFKGGIQFSKLLTYLDVYKTQIHCRYANGYALWTEVHITSVYPPEEAYNFMVDDSQKTRDKIDQLLRRITAVVYHYIENGEFKTFTQSGRDYIDYATLKLSTKADTDGFSPLEYYQEPLPFDIPTDGKA